MQPMCVVLNAGSSSVKYALFALGGKGEATQLCSGLVEKVGAEMGILTHENEGEDKIKIEMAFADHAVALDKVISLLTDSETGKVKDIACIKVVGHRVVHGGEKFSAATVIDEETLNAIKEAAALAPLHNPANITGIEVATKLFNCPQVAVFDTAFHMTVPKEAYMYAIPHECYEKYHIRSYGFHGTSYKYITQAAAMYLNKPVEETNLIICHLGNGASMCAVKRGKSVETSMGLTPLEGLVMGTRSGDIDPAFINHMSAHDMSASDVTNMLNKKSGLLGLCGDSDMRSVMMRADEGDEKAKCALGVYIHRVRKYLGAYLVTLEGNVDALVFTAGVGENSKAVRKLVCADLGRLGINIEDELNENAKGCCEISPVGASIKVMKIPTNEELCITQQSVLAAKIFE